ncbi:AMP-binding protein [Nonomuraea sp. NPDC050451]|uniref:AMP-binding protein n=1 Tax=Nonomuraea sp. NPDC050451 TaxID=3364364 RepID=UPI00379DFACE
MDDVTADVTAAPETMLDLLERRAAGAPEAELVRFEGGASLRVGECLEGATAVAGGLAGLVTGGDRVLTCLPPGPRLVEVMFALARLGAVEVPLALDVRLDAARRLAGAAGARLLIAGTDAVRANPDLIALAAGMERVVLVTGREAAELPGSADLDDLLAAPHRLPAGRPGPADPAVVMATSGTTGRAKGALLPHFAGVRHARRVARTMGYEAGDVLFNVFPWNHINVRHAGLLPALISGATLVAHHRFSASRFWEICRREGVTAFNFMGAIAAILERAPASGSDTRHRVRRAYGGPAPEGLSRRFLERFGVLPLGPDDESLGLSEIVRRTGVAKASVHRLAQELLQWGLLERRGPSWRTSTRRRGRPSTWRCWTGWRSSTWRRSPATARCPGRRASPGACRCTARRPARPCWRSARRPSSATSWPPRSPAPPGPWSPRCR